LWFLARGEKEMVYKCLDDGITYFWREGEIVGCEKVVNGVPQNEFVLLDAPESEHQMRVIEAMLMLENV
jgi:hypothetical protein